MKLFLKAVAVTAGLVAGPLAFANPIPIGDVRVDWSPWHSGSGGEFSVQPGQALQYLVGNYSPLASGQDPANGGANSFQTFCIQAYVDYQPGDIMQASLQNVRLPNNQALPTGVAWLYHQFADGTLPGYYYNSTASGGGLFSSRNDSAAALQNTIWWLVGDAPDPGSANPFRDDILGLSASRSPIANPLSWALSANNPAQIPVEVIVTQYDPSQGGWGDAGTQQGYRQNFLANLSVPDGGATSALLGFAFVGLAVARRFAS